MRRALYLAVCAAVAAGAIWLICRVNGTAIVTARPQATVSPSYWHYIDAVSPMEDTAHYLPKEVQHIP